jgi:divalent metal cation (Fe/Co/Zn/Cd) transporter
MIADAAESAFCAFTSAAALLGVGLKPGSAGGGLDPAAALVIAALAIREGVEAWREEN